MAYAIVLDLRAKGVLVVGGGKVATRKVARLLDEGAVIRLVSPRVSERIEQWAAEGRLTLYKRPYCAEDMGSIEIVFAATNSPSVNAQVSADAHKKGLWVNVADGITPSDFTLPAIARFGPLQLAIDTGGGGPALSRQLRQHLTQTLHPGWARGAAIFTQLRPLVRPLQNEETRRSFWRTLVRDLPDAAVGTDEELIAWVEQAAQESGLILDQSLIRTAIARR
ncbi:MAG: precorrin-2 dehydrogenase/sirohydrochlorin ferrochelatase family protein [Ardenticatenaceae bacterium]